MGMPSDYELLEPKKSFNHICQNVPVPTARDMATEVKKYLEGKLDYADSKLVLQNNLTETHEIWDAGMASIDSFFNMEAA